MRRVVVFWQADTALSLPPGEPRHIFGFSAFRAAEFLASLLFAIYTQLEIRCLPSTPEGQNVSVQLTLGEVLSDQFQPILDGEGRLLLLIAAFSRGTRVLEDWTKLANLDFLLRHPAFLSRALEIRRLDLVTEAPPIGEQDIEGAMAYLAIHSRWDRYYFAILGRLIGKGLVEPVLCACGFGYRATEAGESVASQLSRETVWVETTTRVALLKEHFNLSGKSLMKFVHEHFPEVTRASWGDPDCQRVGYED